VLADVVHGAGDEPVVHAADDIRADPRQGEERAVVQVDGDGAPAAEVDSSGV
jgi:hypothetical protein